MKFKTESGAQYQLTTVDESYDPPLYRVERDSNGEQTSFTAEIIAPLPLEIGSRVMLMVFHEPEVPTYMRTSRVTEMSDV